MKITLTTIMLTFVVTSSFAQVESEAYKTMSKDFVESYNADNFERIFSMFSSNMQKALPLDKTTNFLKGLKSQAGKMIQREFVKYEQISYASYKTNFERGTFSVNISIDQNSKINGLFVKPYVNEALQVLKRNQTKLILPFKEEWTVFWGGDTKELNYHVDNRAQKNAFDIVVTNEKGSSYKTDGKTNEDYYAFGKELIAPCDGEVVLVVDGVKDNKPGELNPVYVTGNTVIIKTDNNEYLVFAHFKQHSIKVRQGQKVQQREVLGLCGNSGNSSEPHLHFHIQNVENMNQATGVKCYFDQVMVNGKLREDHSPVKGDKVKPL